MADDEIAQLADLGRARALQPTLDDAQVERLRAQDRVNLGAVLLSGN